MYQVQVFLHAPYSYEQELYSQSWAGLTKINNNFTRTVETTSQYINIIINLPEEYRYCLLFVVINF